jgi:hypothetical protein
MKYRYRDGDIVKFSADTELSGKGVVVGVAINNQPTLGALYMVKVTESSPALPNKEYPFSTIPMFEIWMDLDN